MRVMCAPEPHLRGAVPAPTRPSMRSQRSYRASFTPPCAQNSQRGGHAIVLPDTPLLLRPLWWLEEMRRSKCGVRLGWTRRLGVREGRTST